MKVVIMAGGKGTRISSVAREIPKSMITIEGKPILEYEIEYLRNQGFRDIFITVGHLGDMIIDYFGNGSKVSEATGKTFGVKIEYYYDEEPVRYAKNLFESKSKLTEDFLVMNAGCIYNIDFGRFVAYHKGHGGLATLLTCPNSHPYDSEIIVTNENGTVEKWYERKDKKPEFYSNRVNSGLYVVSPELIKDVTEEQVYKIDVRYQLIKPLTGTGKIFAYDSHEYVRDLGTLERYMTVCHDFERKKVHIKNLKNKRKAIFIENDGAFNRYAGFPEKINDFELVSCVDEAVKYINDSGYLAVLVNNHSLISEEKLTEEQADRINNKIETILGAGGAYVDAIYSYPHNGDCRQGIEMLYRAAEKLNIDLKESWMVGESRSAIKVGMEAGCAAVKVNEKFNLLHFVKEYVW